MLTELLFYWKLLLRRLPIMALLFLSAASIGGVLAVRLPTTYQSEAQLLVVSPQIPGELANSTVQINATEEVEVIRQQLVTRANLLEIANKYRVFANMRSMSPDDVVQGMRRSTRIGTSGGGRSGGPTLVTVRFEARTGQIAADVVNEYSTRIVEASVQRRTGSAGDTLQFFEQEVERLDEEMAEQSARLAEFQSNNTGALPDSLTYRMNRQSLLLERISAIGRERTSLNDQRERLNQIFEATGRVGSAGGGTAQLSPAEQRLEALENELTNALAVYSESHPRITGLRNQIAQAEKAVASETGAGEAASGDALTPEQLLDVQLAEIDESIAALDEEEARAESELESLKASINATAGNEITLTSMQRDYDTLRQQYENASRSLAQARLGERIELTSRGQRITLLESGSVPNEPSSPNRPKIAATGIAVGGALAAGYFALLELLNRTVRRPAELVRGLNITPIGTIPFIETARHRWWRRTFQVTAFLIVLIGVPIGFWAIDSYYLPLDLLFERVLDRFGLT